MRRLKNALENDSLGRSLQVIKRIYDDNLRQPVAVQSFSPSQYEGALIGERTIREALKRIRAATYLTARLDVGSAETMTG